MPSNALRENKVKELVARIKELEKSKVRSLVRQRIKEFESFKSKGDEDLFSELCFCILTANYTAEGGIRIQRALGKKGFIEMREEELEKRLKELGHRFPRTRAKYIVEARRYLKGLKEKIYGFKSGKEAREWLLQIKGLGMKEASHFLRNIGFKDVAIIDRHILKVLKEVFGFEVKSLTKRKYLEAEKLMEKLAEATGLDLATLDLYLWYMITGKVLK